ncbi:MAG TPA: hypothetical protein PLB21_05725 [Actinomycetota bacterium]|nr:hypothetical protein [Actinomycetota bacterium]
MICDRRSGQGAASRRALWTRRLAAAILGAALAATSPPGVAVGAPVISAGDHGERQHLSAATAPATSKTVGRVPLTVRETAGVWRLNEVVRQGIPLPKNLGLTSTAGLVVVNGVGARVPAEFVVLGRWNAGLAEATAPIQWLLVAFPATVAANKTHRYQLVLDRSAGTNPPPSPAISTTRRGNVFTVNTGAARFTFGGGRGLLDGAWNVGGTSVVRGGLMTAATTSTARHTSIRSVQIEHEGPLYTSVIVTGAYDAGPHGGGGFGSTRRYVFTAGSPTVQIRHAVAWEGGLCSYGALACAAGNPNGIRFNRIRDTLDLTASAPFTVSAVGARSSGAVVRTIGNGRTASVRQLPRPRRTAPVASAVEVGVARATGRKADGGVLAASAGAGTVAIASAQLHRNEPQALRLLGNGDLAVDIADGPIWLTSRQGLYATVAVAALPARAQRGGLDRLVWAPLNRPLHAWPSGGWFAQSQVAGELPDATLPAAWADYGGHVTGVINKTYAEIDRSGLTGLTSFGLYPRYWGTEMGEEVDCPVGQDPTPQDDKDDTFWCATWTDYHNTAATTVARAMQTGQVEWLDDLATPAALRMLHTQIHQCSPADTWFYCGQAPSGYGGYRADFNSSHAYFQNLFLYYWLTGDATVPTTITRGASSMRNYLCARRPATGCLATDPPTDEWAQLTGRVASQWFAAFRFVGTAGRDGSYLDDWRTGLARAATSHYVEARTDGVAYGFWIPSQVVGAGTYTTDQLWLASLYDLENLHQLQLDTGDEPIGVPGLRPSRIINAWARTLVRFGPRVAGDGTAGGTWPNALELRFSGPRIGGDLTAVAASSAGGDTILWNTGKANLTATILRAGRATGDPVLTRMGSDLTRVALDGAKSEGGPLGKIQGLYLARIPAAVALLTTPTVASSTPLSTTTGTTAPPQRLRR